MSEHRVSMIGLRRSEDPETSRDPRLRAVVAALRDADYAPAPDEQFRADLRAQLVAVAPRIIDAGTSVEQPSASRAKTLEESRPLSEQVRRRRFARPLVVAAGVAAAFIMLFGGAVWLSQRALPGDSLYGLKRASENVQLSLSSGGTDRGHEYLSLAQTRVQEARALLRRNSASADGGGANAGVVSSHTAALITANLASADSDIRNGSDLLNTQAVTSKSDSPLDVLTTWAPGQLDRLSKLAGALPSGTLQQRTKSSWTLTNSALTRARQLSPAVAKNCAQSTTTDPLGPLPLCHGVSTATSAPSHPATTHRTAGSTGTAGTGHASTAPAGSTHPAAPKGHAATTPAATTAPAKPGSTPSAPGLPNLLPSKPLTINSCGVSVSLGPINIGLGSCPSHS